MIVIDPGKSTHSSSSMTGRPRSRGEAGSPSPGSSPLPALPDPVGDPVGADPGVPAAGATRDHLLTLVLEDYFQVAPLRKVVRTSQWYRFETRLEHNTRKTLDLLDEYGVKATFFVLGWIADEMPGVVREVVRRGHEIASKGYYHRSLQQFGPEELRDDLRRSRDALQSASGRRVDGFRIAHGWFGPEDLWALDVLAEEGFAYDSSIRPIFRRFADQPGRHVVHQHHHGEHSLWEFPLSAFGIGGWSFPIAGGNYLRQLPHHLMSRAVEHWTRRRPEPLVMYFHIWELDPEQPRIQAAPLLERIRQYRNLEKMEGILRFYLERYRFRGIGDYLGLNERHLDPRASEARGLAPRVVDPGTAGVHATAPRRSHKPRGRQDVTVVIPCFNEELILPYLAKTLDSVAATLEEDYRVHFLLVDDGSTDGTWPSLQQYFGHQPERFTLLTHDENRGVAAAILTGIRHAESEIVCSIDCDCTYDPHQLSGMIPMLEEGVDMVTASPYHPQGQVRNVPAWRLFLSRGLSLLYRQVLPTSLATYTSCFRTYRRSAMLDLPVRGGGFLGVAETLGRLDLRGGRIVEVPAVLEVRLLGRSKMKLLRTCTGHLLLLGRLFLSRCQQGWRNRPSAPHDDPPPDEPSDQRPTEAPS